MSSDQIKSALKSLQSFNIPPPPKPTPTPLTEYTIARNKFIRQRVSEVFLEYAASFNGETFQLPPDSERDLEKENAVLTKVKSISNEVSEKMTKANVMYELFVKRRSELVQLVEDMEEGKEITDVLDDDSDDGDESVDDMDEDDVGDDVMEELLRRKVELEEKLKRVEAECEEAGLGSELMKKKLEQKLRDRKLELENALEIDDEIDASAESKQGEIESGKTDLQMDLEEIDVLIEESDEEIKCEKLLEVVAAELDNRNAKNEEMKKLEVWYEDICEAIGELGGVKILSIDQGDNFAVILKLSLAGNFVLKITLSPLSSYRKRGPSSKAERMIISNAVIDGKKTITDAQDGVVTAEIPSFDDLVKLARGLPQKEDLQFVVREALARICGLESRVEELARLRSKYLTKISANTDEVICSLDEGVTVVIRVLADSPRVPGSVYIEKIVGICGWEQSVLDAVKDIVNKEMHRGALELMDVLVREINAREKPDTPKLLSRKEKH